MFLLMFAAIGGGLATASIMAPFGTAVAGFCAPVGGSFCAILAAFHLARQARPAELDVDAQADTMVASLRDLAGQATPPEKQAGDDGTGRTRAA